MTVEEGFLAEDLRPDEPRMKMDVGIGHDYHRSEHAAVAPHV